MMRWGIALAVCSLLSLVLVPAETVAPAPAFGAPLLQQAAPESVVAITKTVEGGNEFAPGQPFTYDLKYSCSANITASCEGTVISDQLPATLSRNAADVTFGSDVVPAYDATTGLVKFSLGTLKSGSTGQILITVKFPRGTAPGTVATNTATITATNAIPATSAPVQVTAVAASNLTFTKQRLGPAQLDTPLTYRLTATLAAGDTQIIRNARFVDDLPAGVTFVSATGGGTFDASKNQVTWAVGDLVPNPNQAVSTSREVTVIFPSATFKGGQTVTNSSRCLGTPDGTTGEHTYGPANDTATLRAAGPIAGAHKTANVTQIGPGQAADYTVTGTAPADADATTLTITDRLPVGLVAVQDGKPNLSGAGASPVVTAHAGGSSQVVPVTAAGGNWSAVVPPSADSVDVTFAAVPAGTSRQIQLRAGIPASGKGRDGAPVVAGQTLQNCAVVSGDADGVSIISRTSCFDEQVVPISVDFAKRLTSPSPIVAPGGTATWALDLGVPSTSASPLVQPVITDCLPAGFDVPDPANPAAGTTITGLAPPPTVQRAVGACANGGVQLTWSWATAFTLEPGQHGSIGVTGQVADDAKPGSFSNQATLTADNLAKPEVRTVDMVVSSTTLLIGRKFVQGSRDSAFVGSGGEGHTAPGGSAMYSVEIQNVSAVPVNHLVLVDILPALGDTAVRSATSRGSGWRPTLVGPPSSQQAGSVALSYSGSSNPCRSEVGYNQACVQDWSASPPGGQYADVHAFRADFGSFVLAAGGTVTLTWSMGTPSDAPVDSVAWNSFAFTATRADNSEQLVPSEPPEVGLRVVSDAKPSVTIVKRVNGIHAPVPPGPIIPVGTPVVFTYEVTNTGTVTATGASVVDDVLGPIACPKSTLAPGESMTCTSPTELAVAGPHTNKGTVLVAPVEGDPPEPAAADLAYWIGGELNAPLLALVKKVNGNVEQHRPGLNIPEGNTVTYQYIVTNAGASLISDITVTDNKLGVIKCPLRAPLQPGDSVICTAPPQKAIAGTVENEAWATGQPLTLRGDPQGASISSAHDVAYYHNDGSSEVPHIPPTTDLPPEVNSDIPVPPDGNLVVTGASSGPLAALGGVALGAGLGLTGLSKLRPRRQRRRAGKT
jgi:uncharacterized repeat protein (TIGR01451 family)/fimbrial isopeptide formation D2 family protein